MTEENFDEPKDYVEETRGDIAGHRDALVRQVASNTHRLDNVQKQLDEAKETLRPIAEFYEDVSGDIRTVARFARAVGHVVGWLAALVIGVGVITAWMKGTFGKIAHLIVNGGGA